MNKKAENNYWKDILNQAVQADLDRQKWAMQGLATMTAAYYHQLVESGVPSEIAGMITSNFTAQMVLGSLRAGDGPE